MQKIERKKKGEGIIVAGRDINVPSKDKSVLRTFISR
jgi:hypothetical protein